MMGDKKKSITPYAIKMTLSSEQAHEALELLRNAIERIYRSEASQLSFEELYRNAYNLVIQKQGKMLYEGIKSMVTDKISSIGSALATTADQGLLASVALRWSEHKTYFGMIKDILMYLDKSYVAQNALMSVYNMGLAVFSAHVICKEDMSARLQRLLLDLIQKERAGDLIERDTVKSVLSMLVELGIGTKRTYEAVFEAAFLQVTKTYYCNEATALLDRETCSGYLRHAEERLKQERDKTQRYLDPSTEKPLMALVEDCFIVQNSKYLLDMESGCIQMLHHSELEDLSRLYRLFKPYSVCLRQISDCMAAYIHKQAGDILQDPQSKASPEMFITALLRLRNQIVEVVSASFRRDILLEAVMKQAFEDVLNTNCRTATFLSQYVDRLFRKDIKGLSEAEIDSRLDSVIDVFRYIRDKDVFETLYKNALAKRLLHEKSLSDDAERLMITKLKTECGYQFTVKLEGMFNDMKLSKQGLEQYTRPQGNYPELSVRVLTISFWPSDKCTAINLPEELAVLAEHYRQYYLTKHTGRRLTWKASLGTAELRAFLSDSRTKHELIVSTYQMCILMLFNTYLRLSGRDIREILSAQDEELEKHLLGLVACKVLLKSSSSKKVEPEAEFSVNPDFQSKLYRIKVPLISKKDATLETTGEEPPEVVEDDRRHMIEASIVRIMKARRKVDHNELVAEVIRQLAVRFTPNPKAIKTRVEALIEREYLERDGEDHRYYKYVA